MLNKESVEFSCGKVLDEDWDGSGIPPVGTVCEYLSEGDHCSWGEVKIIGVDGDLIVFRPTDGEIYYSTKVGGKGRFVVKNDKKQIILQAILNAANSERSYIPFTKRSVELIYQAIKEGQIPGVTLTGETI